MKQIIYLLMVVFIVVGCGESSSSENDAASDNETACGISGTYGCYGYGTTIEGVELTNSWYKFDANSSLDGVDTTAGSYARTFLSSDGTFSRYIYTSLDNLITIESGYWVLDVENKVMKQASSYDYLGDETKYKTYTFYQKLSDGSLVFQYDNYDQDPFCTHCSVPPQG